MRVALWVVLGLALAGYLLLAVRGMNPFPDDRKANAISACESSITKRLIAPISAKFSGTANSTVKSDAAGNLIVIAYVDSQNSYGAMIRTPYTCTVSRDGIAVLSGID